VTQISNLSQIDGARTSFTITRGAVFQYAIVFPDPLGPQVPLIATAAMTAGNPTLSNLPAATVASLVTGQPVVGYGIPTGTIISAIPNATSVTLSQAVTQTGGTIGVTFQVVPLDITGISFRQQIRRTAEITDASVLLDMSTDNGRLINGGSTGVLAAHIDPQSDPSAFNGLPVTGHGTSLVTDIVASASDSGPVNLMGQSSPASVFVLSSVTR
jgi:hypothetical protein